MKTVFRNNAAFLIPYALFLVAGAVLILVNAKSDTHLEFNDHHNHFFDVFFRYATYLGDGFMALLTVIILLVVNYRFALIAGLSNLISALITQTLKHTIFSDIVRPKKFFEGVHDIYLVPNVDNYLYNSFPSGHSTCAFALYLAAALLIKNKILKFVCFLLAITVGYSRIYLSQHFFEDVYAGSLIGVSCTLAVFYFMSQSKAQWLDRSLISRKNKV